MDLKDKYVIVVGNKFFGGWEGGFLCLCEKLEDNSVAIFPDKELAISEIPKIREKKVGPQVDIFINRLYLKRETGVYVDYAPPLLKPCPFCGGDDMSIDEQELGDDVGFCVVVQCRNCPGCVKSEPTKYDKQPLVNFVVEAWNRRSGE